MKPDTHPLAGKTLEDLPGVPVLATAKPLYTTSEYLDALTVKGGEYQCKGKDFIVFSNAEAADSDAQFLVDFYKREGVKKRKPTVYRIRLERVKLASNKRD